jgi:hypothetical protein
MAGNVALCNIHVGIRGKTPRRVVAYCNSPMQDATQGLEAGRKAGAFGPCGIAEFRAMAAGDTFPCAVLSSCGEEGRAGVSGKGEFPPC